jgi:hypothetical protein
VDGRRGGLRGLWGVAVFLERPAPRVQTLHSHALEPCGEANLRHVEIFFVVNLEGTVLHNYGL